MTDVNANNRKRSKSAQVGATFAARLYQNRFAISIGSAYLAVFFWLLFGHIELDASPGMIYETRGIPQWMPPGGKHWFGTTFTGIDVFQLSRLGMATTATFAIVTALLGVGTALLLALLANLTGKDFSHRVLRRTTTAFELVPAMLIFLIVTAGSRGDGPSLILCFSIVIAAICARQVSELFRQRQAEGEVIAGLAVGLSRMELILRRDLPAVSYRCLGIVANLLAPIMLAEMALSFLGLTGERISCGRLVQIGSEFLIEAPWLAVYPGLLALIIVAIFSLLGWCVAGIAKCKPATRPF